MKHLILISVLRSSSKCDEALCHGWSHLNWFLWAQILPSYHVNQHMFNPDAHMFNPGWPRDEKVHRRILSQSDVARVLEYTCRPIFLTYNYIY